ncbi:hypothetical protein QRD02_12010 [Aequorivita sp. SDUM287046]|uniref:Toxin-antitoxin system YwqK family antitoxin n=1 Tax=Aequorivita aurantiaca TaxID=3053356 RepID=A0ABT8DI91_9FLAO|nr:toxin-antitoxin system YwqK family antitoxin [Aequorivita aurantiaca]MDN3725111.1 hypothetical protein [Aequorivita aurantiaca]
MAKIIFFISLVLLLFSKIAIAQPGNFYNYSSGTDSIFLKKKLVVRNASKDTLEIAALKNGKKHGKQTLFYNNGEVQRISNFKNGLLNGKVEYFAQGNEALIRLEHFKAFPKEGISKLHGVYKSFDSNGNLAEFTHYKNGIKNGKYELYHNNGKLREKGTYEDNLNIGNKRSFTADSKLLRDENYIIIDNPKYIEPSKETNAISEDIKRIPKEPKKLSVLHGKVKYYDFNGNISADFTFKNGKKDGLNKEYHQDNNNTLKSEVVFKEGLEHGTYVHYRSNGNLERKGIYYREIAVGDTILQNVYDGTIEVYQENGKRHRIENWKNFKKNGVQENYYYKSGELSERSYIIDNLLSGTVERFDKEGNKTYEAFHEIVEKEGKNVSQQIGTETYWEKNKIKTIVEWKDGMQNGVTKTYYANGQLEKIMHFENGKLHGSYQTFNENGQLTEDYNKHIWAGTGNSENVGWNTVYDESGTITRKFYADETGKNLIEHNFENGKRKEMGVNNIFKLTFSESHQLNSVHWLHWAGSSLGFDLFSNQQVRRVQFSMDKLPALTANFASNGDVVQIVDATGKRIENKTAIETAEKIVQQYNPKWKDKKLASDDFPDGKYQWKYADGSAFFELEFKDDLSHGQWMLHNPIIKDTLFYGEFHKGFPVGSLVRKKIDGTLELRQEYYPNHHLKESYRYDNDGMISNVTKNDTLGKQTFSEEYYEGGIIKNRNFHTSSSYIHFSAKGDTIGYRLLAPSKDSIIIRRQFYDDNKLKSDRQYNLTTGGGYVKTYFENGQIQTSHQLNNDKPHGVYQKYSESGTLLTSGNFKDGERHGKWINYNENGKEEISYFKDGEISIEDIAETENAESSCRCYDTSLAGGKIGFANLLNYFADYKSIKPYIPKSIFPVNAWNYDKIFYVNLNTHNDRRSGATNLKLLLFNDFSFYYPTKNHLNITLNPCKTEGYIGNIDANVSYNFESKEVMYAQLSPKRISVGLENNPLGDAKDKSVYTAYFDTDYMNFNASGIESIHFSKEKNECYPLGIINDFMEIKIETANLEIQPHNRLSNAGVPLLASETNQFYGLEINAAAISFMVDAIKVEASCDKILAGANYVAGRLSVGGNLTKEDEFTLADGKGLINIKNLQKTLEQNGFYRVKTEVIENRLMIEFYAEK